MIGASSAKRVVMRNADLGPSTQVVLITLLGIAWAVLLTRAIVFVRREYAGSQPLFPQIWSVAQRRALEWFRASVGIALLALWGAFLSLAPAMPVNWPFGYTEVLSLIVLLLMSYAWLLLLAPGGWRRLGALSRSFSVTIAFLVVWWAVMIAATGWMLAKASASAPSLVPPPAGVFAARPVPPGRDILS